MGGPDVIQQEYPGSSKASEPSPRRRRRRHSRSKPRGRHSRVRKLYFAMAAVWGFLIGTAAVLGGLAALGRPLHLDPLVAFVLVAAGVLALLGGFVVAAAYREASGRFR